MSLRDFVLNFFFVILKEIEMEMFDNFVQCLDFFESNSDFFFIIVGEIEKVNFSVGKKNCCVR